MERRHMIPVLLLAGASPLAWVAITPASAQGASTTTGELTKVDKAGGRVEIHHGGIKNLDMPPMRMSFRVRDPRLLDGLAVGDKVRFAAEKIDGQFTVTSLSKAP
jgi:Cu(I)/Ag(I) efflux system protein CusF